MYDLSFYYYYLLLLVLLLGRSISNIIQICYNYCLFPSFVIFLCIIITISLTMYLCSRFLSLFV